MATGIKQDEVCEYHYDSQTLLTSINTKLTGLMWVIGIGITVFSLPLLIYVVNLEKRMSTMENVVTRLVAQRNSDHPAKDSFR